MSVNYGGGVSPLELFGAKAEDIDVGPERKRGVSREICVCGHPMAHHETVYEGLDSCQESKMFCPCRHKKAVLEAEDLRAFKFSSEGYGRDHALWKGLKKLRNMGKGAVALVDSRCWKCFEERPIEPVSLTPENRVSRQPQARNVMVCMQCRYVLEGIDPSFLVSEEKSFEVSDASVEVDEEVEPTLAVTTTGWHDAFSSESANDAPSVERGEELETIPTPKRVASFEKLTEAPY